MSTFSILRPVLRSVASISSTCLRSTHFVLRRHASSLRKAIIMPDNPIFQAIQKHDPKSIAIIHSESGRTFSYGSLLYDVAAAKERLLQTANGKPLSGERIAFLAENGYDYVGAHPRLNKAGRQRLPYDQLHSSPSLPTMLSHCHYPKDSRPPS